MSRAQKRAAARRAYMRQRNPYAGRVPSGNTGLMPAVTPMVRPAARQPRGRSGSAGQKAAITVLVLLLAAALFVALVQPDFIFKHFAGSTPAVSPPSPFSGGSSAPSPGGGSSLSEPSSDLGAPSSSAMSSSPVILSSSAEPSSSSTPSQAAPATVRVFVGAAQNGSLLVDGRVETSYSLYLLPGTLTGQVTAVANPGYRFTGWSVNAGALADPGAETVNYIVPGGAMPGGTITLMANFEYVGIKVPKLIWFYVWDVVQDGMHVGEWQVNSTIVIDAGQVPGTVLTQSPGDGSYVHAEAPKVIDITVAAVPTPNLAGVDLTGLTEYDGWTITQVSTPNASPAGTYLSQSPAPGAAAIRRGTITVTVSAGPESPSEPESEVEP